MGMNEDLQKQLINDLLIESFEGLDRFDQYLLDLEKGDGGSETLNGIFRVIHTIKGTSGCIALTRIEKLAHVGENLLSLLRDGKLTVKPMMITALLRLSDGLRDMLRTLERDGNEGNTDYTELKDLLTKLQDPDAVFVEETRGSLDFRGHLAEEVEELLVPGKQAKSHEGGTSPEGGDAFAGLL